MKNWLEENELWDKLSKNDKETFYEDVVNLKEDLEFFTLYLKRNKKSKFNFNISFSKGLNTKFLNDLYTKSYGYHTNYLEKLYKEYLIAIHFFNTLYDAECEVVYNEDTLKTIYNHFLNLHSMKLEDYVGDFIGCSRGCMHVSSEIIKLASK